METASFCCCSSSLFLYYTTHQALAAGETDGFIHEIREQTRPATPRPIWQEAGRMMAGLAGVSLGPQWAVDGAVELARGFGVSQAVIGLTVISLGTTLPELATCITAARRGDADIALGNLGASNLLIWFALAE